MAAQSIANTGATGSIAKTDVQQDGCGLIQKRLVSKQVGKRNGSWSKASIGAQTRVEVESQFGSQLGPQIAAEIGAEIRAEL